MGQSGPLAHAAGHDIDYIAISGALHAIGTKARPVVPLNLIGDYGGGALYLAMGLLAALVHARATGQGQVVDAAMSDGAASLMSYFYGLHAAGSHRPERAANMLDGGAPFYDVYCCSDGEWIALGAIEPQFHANLLKALGLEDEEAAHARWSATPGRHGATGLLHCSRRGRAPSGARSLKEATPACPGIGDGRGAGPSSQSRAANLRRARGRRAASAGAALFRHPGRDPGAAARHWRAQCLGLARLGSVKD